MPGRGKFKYAFPSFAGKFDPDAYVNWEIALDKEFEYYDCSDRQKIRAATSVFVEDAILWWKYLNRHGRVPQSDVQPYRQV